MIVDLRLKVNISGFLAPRPTGNCSFTCTAAQRQEPVKGEMCAPEKIEKHSFRGI